MKLRGAMVGLGNIAFHGHIPAYLADDEMRDSFEIVAGMDLADEHARRFKECFPGGRTYQDFETLLDQEELDFVDICTPPSTHAHYILRCSARKLHVLCEKPLTDNYASSEAVVEQIKGSHTVIMPCHQYRHSPLWMEIGRRVRSGEVGRVTLAQWTVLRTNADSGSAAWIPDWRTRKLHSGGGILADTGAHYLHMAQHMFGMPASLTAALRILKHGQYDVEDTALVLLDYHDMLIQLSLTWAAGQRSNNVTITGTDGVLSYDGTRLRRISPTGTEDFAIPNVSDKTQYVGWYASLFKEFHARVVSANFADDHLLEALNVMKLLNTCYRSAMHHTVESVA